MSIPTAQLVRRRVILGALPLLALVATLALHQILALLNPSSGSHASSFAIAYLFVFALFLWQTLLVFADRPATPSPGQQRDLDRLRVLVPIPLYNEDPEAIRREVIAILAGTRLPSVIFVVDDGSTKADYTDVRRWFHHACTEAGVVSYWKRQDNGGKREAQGTAIRAVRAEHDIDVIWTLDSDVQPDRRCLEEGLKPLVNPKVQSVASVVLTSNTRDSMLARFMDLMFMSLQLTERSAMSAAGSVMVNSGASAFYRASVIIDNLDAYLSEVFFNRKVTISDDSMLTLFGLLKGRTVQQPTSLAFTTMPHKIRPHLKQQGRWARGSFIRSWWRMRYLPTNRFAFWWHLLRWAGFGVNVAVLGWVFAVEPLRHWHGSNHYLALAGWSVLIQVTMGYAVTLRYFCVRRSDQSLAYQIGTYLMTPLVVLWSATVLRVVRWHAMLTCLNMRWGTREVTGAGQVVAPSVHRDLALSNGAAVAIPAQRYAPRPAQHSGQEVR